MIENNGEINDYTFEEIAALTAERDTLKTALRGLRELVRGHNICRCNQGIFGAFGIGYICPIDAAEKALEKSQ